MDSTLDILAAAFYEADPHLAVFDVDARQRAGLWELPGHVIPIDEVVAIVAECDAFHAGDRLILPLHEVDSAELTGSYVVEAERDGTRSIGFFDFSEGAPHFLPTAEFGETTLALRARFWHPDYRPPRTPSYLSEAFSFEAERGPPDPSVPPSRSGTVDASFFEDQKLFIARQRDAARETARTRYHSLRGRGVDAVEGIAGLAPAGRRIDDAGDQVCMLDLPDPGDDESDSHRIAPGVEVLVDVHEGGEGFPVDAEIAGVSGRRIDLHVTWSTSNNHGAAESAFNPDGETAFRLIPLVDPSPYEHQQAAVESIETDDRKRPVVLGDRSLEFDDGTSVESGVRSLNQYQQRAVRRALGAADVFCIHGPPGTGKTRTAVNLIREAARRGEKVLATAPSTAAVDDLLVGASTPEQVDRHSLHADAVEEAFVIARAGQDSSNEVVTNHYTGVEFWEANVVGATTADAHRFRTDQFDLVVIDEASRCGIPSTLIPYVRGRRLVLVGDHYQLPPHTSDETDAEERTAVSLFEHLVNVYGGDVTTLLRKQYRMNEAIAAFPNEAFYGGALRHGQRNRGWTIRDLDPLVGVHVEGEERRTPGGSYYNEREAAVVAGEVDRLLRHGVPASQLAVITPYSGQVGKVVQAIDDPDVADRITVSTIDGFRGGGRDAIVVSFVRSNPTGDTGYLTFPTEGPRRLNVALTRARKRCTLIGDWETLRAQPAGDPGSGDASHLFDALYAHLANADALTDAGVEAR